MDSLWVQVAAVAVGGSLGAVSRMLAGRLLADAAFPWATVAVNLAGCFALGLLIGATHDGIPSHRALRVAVGTGFLGAFTTFSTFSVEAVALAEKERWVATGLYVGGQVILGLALAAAGIVAGRTLRG
ncbi:MAG TPA: fluoride efflux transporter CrcB [Pirellulaceae bacterium]|nr:fluoride efflux transporter CrcB [Pirellulaceae bacterium]